MPQLTVAYDYICPWCWVAWEQAKRLKTEFPTLELIWKGYELLPEGLAYNPPPPDPNPVKKPRIPSRFELLLAADGLTLPKREHPFSRSRLALEGAEYALEVGKADEYHDTVYHTYWEEDRDISDKAVLTEVAEAAGLDVAAFLGVLEDRRYRDRIVEYDDPAHAAGIWNVPTWMFPEEWIAEQPYSVVRAFAERFMRDQHE
jgi:predicted DsbA family dithiol-disulfide isomerase